MQDLLEKHLDQDISHTLKFDTTLSSAQKAAAWDRLHARVMEQTMLPPLEPAPQVERTDWVGLMVALRDSSVKLLNMLILDSSAFERANLPKRRYPYPYFDIHGRCTHPIMALSA